MLVKQISFSQCGFGAVRTGAMQYTIVVITFYRKQFAKLLNYIFYFFSFTDGTGEKPGECYFTLFLLVYTKLVMFRVYFRDH